MKTKIFLNMDLLYDLILTSKIKEFKCQFYGRNIEVNEILPEHGVGLLHVAVGIEPCDISLEVTAIILKHNGDPNLRSVDGLTPVHIASIWGRLENLKLLVACGGDPFLKDYSGKNAYEHTLIEEQWDICEYLNRLFGFNGNEDSIEIDAYSIYLDKVMLSSGTIVAEYCSDSRNCMVQKAICSKSLMVQEWCDDNSKNSYTKPDINIIKESNSWASYDSISNLANQTLEHDEIMTKLNCSKKYITNSFHIDETNLISDDNDLHQTELDGNEKNILDKNLSGFEKIEFTGSIHDEYSCFYKQNSNSIGNSETTNINKFLTFQKADISNSPLNDQFVTKERNKICDNTYTVSILTSDRSSFVSNDSINVTEDKSDYDNQYREIASMNGALTTMDQNGLTYSINEITDSKYSSDDELGKYNKLMLKTESEYNESRCYSSESAFYTIKSSFNADHNSLNTGNFLNGNRTASIEEEYRYEDKDEGVILIEKRLPPVKLKLEDIEDAEISNDGTSSVASSLPVSIDYDIKTLRLELIKCGFNPGPISNTTKRLYLRKLHNLRKNPIIVKNKKGKTFSMELQKTFQDPSWCQDLSQLLALERKAKDEFTNPRARPAKAWREGSAKTSFTYLLLDPRITDNLPCKAETLPKNTVWEIFIDSIFYIGKGKRSRPYSHLYQAQHLWKMDFQSNKDKKVQHILDIWSDNVGVICLHVFQNIIPVEAYTYEAAMIDTIGLGNLKNLKTGNYYGAVGSWPLKERRLLGLCLLYKAMLIFLTEGERQLRPDDID